MAVCKVRGKHVGERSKAMARGTTAAAGPDA